MNTFPKNCTAPDSDELLKRENVHKCSNDVSYAQNRKYSYQQLADTLPAAELPVAPLRRSFRSFSSCRGPALRQAPSRAPSTGWSSCTALHEVQLSQLQFLRPFKMISALVFSLFFISSHHSLTLDL